MIPNLLTGFRVLMVFPILTCIAKGEFDHQMFRVAAMLFLIAICTDMLDGFFARRLHQESLFGAMFDLAADRLLMTPALIVMLARGAFKGVNFIGSPAIYVLIIIVADITIIAGLFMYSRLRKKDPSIEFPRPTPIVKATYPAQALVVFTALLSVRPGIINVFMIASAALTIAAFVSYMKKGGFIFKKGLPIVLAEAANEFKEDPLPAEAADTEKKD